MMNLKQKLINTLLKPVTGLAALWCAGVGNALAVLPQQVPPSTGAPAGNWLALIEGYIKDGGLNAGSGDRGDRVFVGLVCGDRQIQRCAQRPGGVG